MPDMATLAFKFIKINKFRLIKNNLRSISTLKHNILQRPTDYKTNSKGADVNSKRYWQPVVVRQFHLSSYKFKTVPFLLADIGEGIKEVVLKEWYVKEGDIVSQFENVCEVQSDKASVTITSRYDGKVVKLYCDVDETVLVGKPLIDIEVEKEEYGTVGAEVQEREAIAVGGASNSAVEDDSFQLPSGQSKILTTPAVRRVAMEYKVDLNQVNGTGKDGRILKEDVLRFISGKKTPQASVPDTRIAVKEVAKTAVPVPAKSPINLAPKPAPIILTKDIKQPIKGYKKAMVKTMTEAMKIPHFGYCDEIDMSSMVRLRPQLKAGLEEHNLRFSYLLFMIKAASMALLRYPSLNASVDEKCENVTIKASHNIGFAMDTSDGLVVPNVKGVQELSILEIAGELMRLQECGARGTFSSQDVTGGTITLSNIGSIGGTYTKPIILPPEAVIGALGKIQKLPRFDINDDTKVIPKHIMQVSWSADHRIIDGATMARFSNLWKNYLENPSSMILSLK